MLPLRTTATGDSLPLMHINALHIISAEDTTMPACLNSNHWSEIFLNIMQIKRTFLHVYNCNSHLITWNLYEKYSIVSTQVVEMTWYNIMDIENGLCCIIFPDKQVGEMEHRKIQRGEIKKRHNYTGKANMRLTGFELVYSPFSSL